jgi:hypothetical protein
MIRIIAQPHAGTT